MLGSVRYWVALIKDPQWFVVRVVDGVCARLGRFHWFLGRGEERGRDGGRFQDGSEELFRTFVRFVLLVGSVRQGEKDNEAEETRSGREKRKPKRQETGEKGDYEEEVRLFDFLCRGRIIRVSVEG